MVWVFLCFIHNIFHSFSGIYKVILTGGQIEKVSKKVFYLRTIVGRLNLPLYKMALEQSDTVLYLLSTCATLSSLTTMSGGVVHSHTQKQTNAWKQNHENPSPSLITTNKFCPYISVWLTLSSWTLILMLRSFTEI